MVETVCPRRASGSAGLFQAMRLLVRRLRRATRQQAAYRRWVEQSEPRGPAWSRSDPGPLFSILMAVDRRPDRRLAEELEAIRRQSYPHWELCVAGDSRRLAVVRRMLASSGQDRRIRFVEVSAAVAPASLANAALASATGRFVLAPGGRQILATDALGCFAAAAERHPEALIFYADEDRIGRRGRRHAPFFKCDFNQILLLTHDAVSHPVVCDRRVACDIGGWREQCADAEHLDFVLRAAARAGRERIEHLPLVLGHRRTPPPHWAARSAAERRAVADHLARIGWRGSVEAVPEAAECHRVRLALPATPPLVSIIVCTRDNALLLRRCIASIRARTSYRPYEIVVMDNGSRDPAATALLAACGREPGVEVVRDDSPFNFSRLNNAAVARARGEVVCLLNDDTEVLTPAWLEEMVSLALIDEVGAVGARLWYPDGSLQHGGVILDPHAVATHVFPRYRRGDTGYAHRAVVQQELSAVTAACLVVRRNAFLAVGGFDEQLAVAFNDVDLCLRLRRAGYRTVWTPFAELVHHESVSRGRDDDPAKRRRYDRERAFMLARWGAELARDPCYGPHFSTRWADYSIVLPAAANRDHPGRG